MGACMCGRGCSVRAWGVVRARVATHGTQQRFYPPHPRNTQQRGLGGVCVRCCVRWSAAWVVRRFTLSVNCVHVVLCAQDSLIDVCEDYTAPRERLGGARQHGESE